MAPIGGRHFIHSNNRANEFLGNNQSNRYGNSNSNTNTNPEFNKIRQQRLARAEESAKNFEEDLLSKFRSKSTKPALLKQSEKGCSDKFKQDLLQKSESEIRTSQRLS